MPLSPQTPPRSLDEWLLHIESLHRRSIDLNLDRPRRVLHRLRPERPPVVITVAGTNGKGTTAAMLEAVYREAGYKVGCYTSPHLVSYCERIRIDGKAVSESALCRSFERVEQARSGIPLTYFEFGTLAALDSFATTSVDLAVLEVGLGGRLDATNIVSPDLSIITAIDLDHQDWLGPSRESIACEKAGILRFRGKAVISDPRPPLSLERALRTLKCDARILNRDFSVSQGKGGAWCWRADKSQWPRGGQEWKWSDEGASPSRIQNLAGVVAAVRQLAHRVPTRDSHLKVLASVLIPGRQQFVPGPVSQIFDVAHNAQAVAELACLLGRTAPIGKTRAVFSLLKEKDLASIMSEMETHVDVWYLAEVDTDRAMPFKDLHTNMSGLVIADLGHIKEPQKVYQRALQDASPGDRIVIFGSFYLVGAILAVGSERTAA